MNVKDQITIIAMQEQVITMLLKIKVLENLFIEKNIFTADEYNTKLSNAAEAVAIQLKPVYEQLDKLNKILEQNKAAEVKEPESKEGVKNAEQT